MAPERIGPYLTDRKLGAGGMGTVYHAIHEETKQEAAIKVLPASLAREEGFVARFEREIDALSRLKNPHIVELYDAGVAQMVDGDSTGEVYFYAMEFVDGETLTTLIRRQKRLSWETVINYSLQICTALKSAHDSGVIHRDLKPSNLMVSREGIVKLTDFGVAQVFASDRLTVTGGVIGTAEFMSPEQAAGRKASKHSDLYSLGAVMYAMLTGRPPFTAEDSMQVMHKHRFNQCDEPRRYAPDMPIWLNDIVCQLLEKEPTNRFPDAFVLSRRLEEVPKKVALSQGQRSSDQTVSLNPQQREEQTRTDSGDFLLDQPESDPAAQFSEGTLMRELVRAELEAEQAGTPISRFFDNIWVLISLLILLIVGGVFWFRGQSTPEKEFQAGVAIMKKDPGVEWFTARDDHFLPLLEADPEEWEEKVRPYLDEIELYQLKRELGLAKGSPRREEVKNEGQLLLVQADRAREAGNRGKAEQILQAMLVLFKDRKGYETHVELAEQMLQQIKSEDKAAAERDDLLSQWLNQAETLFHNHKVGEAQQIWESIVLLYADTPAAQPQVRRARNRLSEIP